MYLYDELISEAMYMLFLSIFCVYKNQIILLIHQFIHDITTKFTNMNDYRLLSKIINVLPCIPKKKHDYQICVY